MPVYNCEKYLREQLNSLLIQKFIDFELIIIDDSSTDTTLLIAESYKNIDKRIKICANEFQKGIVGGLNTGLKYAIGKYIVRADGDDITLADRIEIQYKFLEKNQKIDIIGGGAFIFSESGIIRTSKYPTRSVELSWLFISNSYFCHPTVMFRKSLYNKFGGYPNEKVSEDFAYFSKILRSHRGSNIKKTLIKYRVHEKNSSLEYSEFIQTYIKKKYQENYEFYIPTLDYINEFYLLQTNRQLSPLNFFKITIINFSIINKIRVNYKMSYLNIDYLFSCFSIFYRIIFASFNFIFQNYSFYFKSKIINKYYDRTLHK